MKWILYLMLFSTPAANVTGKHDKTCLLHKDLKEIRDILKCRPLFEKGRIWSLQTTSKFNYSSFESCVRTQDQLMADTNVASTMTLRTWCFCEADNDKCPPDALIKLLAATYRNCEARGIVDCEPEVTKTTKDFNDRADAEVAAHHQLVRPPETMGRGSSSIRLYPPP